MRPHGSSELHFNVIVYTLAKVAPHTTVTISPHAFSDRDLTGAIGYCMPGGSLQSLALPRELKRFAQSLTGVGAAKIRESEETLKDVPRHFKV